MPANPPALTRNQRIAYALLVACGLAAVVVPLLLLSHFGYVREMRWSRIFGLFLAGIAGVGAGIGLVYGAAGAAKGLAAKAITGLTGAGSGLGIAVTATVATTAVVVGFTQLAPQKSGFNSAAKSLNEELASVSPELKEVLPPPIDPEPDRTAALADSSLALAETPTPTTDDGAGQERDEAPTENEALATAEQGAKDTDATYDEPGLTDQEGAGAERNSLPEPATGQAAKPATTDPKAEEAPPAAGAAPEEPKRKEKTAVKYNETNLTRQGVGLVLRLPIPAQAEVTRVQQMFATLKPLGEELTFGPNQPYRVLVGPSSGEVLPREMLAESVRGDRSVVGVTWSRTELPGWEVLKVVRRGHAPDGGYSMEYILYTTGGRSQQLVKVFSPTSYPSPEAAQAEAKTLRLRRP